MLVKLFMHSTHLNVNIYMGDLVELYTKCNVNCVCVCLCAVKEYLNIVTNCDAKHFCVVIKLYCSTISLRTISWIC